MPSLILTPAYGRDYKSKAETLAAFHSEKDFIIQSALPGYAGLYCSKRDLAAFILDGFTHLEIRYRKMTLCIFIDIRKLL